MKRKLLPDKVFLDVPFRRNLLPDHVRSRRRGLMRGRLRLDYSQGNWPITHKCTHWDQSMISLPKHTSDAPLSGFTPRLARTSTPVHLQTSGPEWPVPTFKASHLDQLTCSTPGLRICFSWCFFSRKYFEGFEGNGRRHCIDFLCLLLTSIFW